MSEESRICPYTGLRSFTEEESLYFKGRDAQIDQISKLLERNKFLMVTGASGEGKSSLIFAGLIPNARAGFFRARYNNWVVADFRPERTPVKNLAAAVAGVIGTQTQTAETELRRGFASLVDLYTSSALYIDERDEKWLSLPEDGKKARKRNAANLLILVDQFEEFFTNPENFHHGAPSQDSQIVVNVLLETARIALNENLPIYVVCTMRSDYIGQCSAFRDLPEYIGFSQFFVPRLKRKDLKQIIEEPAVLSGNRISQRLVERLVYDLAEGIDQLPILQHALSQIWLAADSGTEEMDLIHYAKVGGMPQRELPQTDQQKFETWFLTLPEYQRNFYKDTGLDRVIELHANRLYEGAWEYYNQEHPEKLITQRDAKNIIALTFACLTKIDNSRAVRNRMTLYEITRILNRPELTSDVVGGVLNLFREDSNSFIRPFKTGALESQSLAPDSVLDITHESLIRNWGRLNKWANQEFEFYTTFLDFKKQLGRWLEHRKSKGYLLPIGPLSFFESWYAQCKPNTYWIDRYSENKGDPESLVESENALRNIQEFLRKSARKVIVTRSFMKYGANRIAAVTAIGLMVIFSGFYWYNADQKKNSSVIENVLMNGRRLIESSEVDVGTKADYLITEERYEAGTLLNYLSRMKDGKARMNLSLESYKELLLIDKHLTRPVKMDLIRFIDKELLSQPSAETGFLVEKSNLFVTLLAYDNYYNPSPESQSVLTRNASALFSLLKAAWGDKGKYKSGISSRLNLSVSHWLTFGKPGKGQIVELINLISPWGQPAAKAMFDVYYSSGNYEVNYDFDMDYGGGYQVLASLYAASGDVPSVIACFEKLIAAPNYFSGAHGFNNHTNILGLLYSYEHGENVNAVVQWIATHTSLTQYDVYSSLINHTGYLEYFYAENFSHVMRSYFGNFSANLNFLDTKILALIWSDYESVISKIVNPSERDFKMALALKQRALFQHKNSFDKGLAQDTAGLRMLLDKSWEKFEKVPESYLEGKLQIPYRYYLDGKRSRGYTRKQQYLYPDHVGGWSNYIYHSDLFFNYLIGKKDIAHLYKTPEDLKLFHYWVANAHEIFPRGGFETFNNTYPLGDKTLQQILDIVESHPQKNSFDTNLLNMMLANRAFQRGDEAMGLKYFRAVKLENIYSSANTYEYVNKTFVYNQLKDLSSNLIKRDKIAEALACAEKFEKPQHVIISYLIDASEMYDRDFEPKTFVLLDSALSKMKKVDLNILDFDDDFRFRMLFILGKIGGEDVEHGAVGILKDMNEDKNWIGRLDYILGLSSQGSYYKAMVAIPSSFTETQELISHLIILNVACAEKERSTGVQSWNQVFDYFNYNDHYVFYEPF